MKKKKNSREFSRNENLAGLCETGRNAFSRGVEHLNNKEADDANKSVLKLHSIHHHDARADVNFSMKVTGSHPNCLDRQVRE